MSAPVVLFCEPGSVYLSLGVECYDRARDARTWPGGGPAVAHPPCRSWSQLAPFARPLPGERRLAIWAVLMLRRWGGVLEHPARSALWPRMALPEPGAGMDAWGGWTLPVDQYWWGHEARKRTRLYVVGCKPQHIPAIPLAIGEAPRTMGLYSGRDRERARPEVPKSRRSSTPPAFACWLLDLAGRCSRPCGPGACL